MAATGRLGRQKETGSPVEMAMGCYKEISGPGLRARSLPGQRAEATIGVAVLKRMPDDGRPNSVRH